MKKIMNRSETMVPEMCAGIALAYPELEFVKRYKIIKKREQNADKVSLISGGGSGHEPAHAGFVGKGMLDAAVCGDIFASPSQIQIYQAIKETAGNAGTLMIIKNYSGDMMNFKNAARLAEEDGISVEYVKVDDDIAVQDSLYTVGRRGVAGTVLVHKVAGAAAEKGYSLKQVKAYAENAVLNTRSIGFAFTSCTVPAKGTPTFSIAENEIEYGVGIHGEPGVSREAMMTADELSKRMTDSLVKELGLSENDEVTVLVNGFGGTPLQELYLFLNSTAKILDEYKIKIYRSFAGNYMTSIDMSGASLTFMKMNSELKSLLDAESDAPAFKVNGPVLPRNYEPFIPAYHTQSENTDQKNHTKGSAKVRQEILTVDNMIFIVDTMSECIIKNEVPFCELDAYAGDGDFGMSVSKGFRQLRREWNDILEEKVCDIGEFLDACSLIIMECCGGASGPIWGSAFRAAGKAAKGKQKLTAEEFAVLLQEVVTGIQKTGEYSFGRGAVVGDKTLIDALVPCADVWTENAGNKTLKELFQLSAGAAVNGAKMTEKIVARMGRAGTVGKRSIGYPDAGAFALGVIFSKIADALIFEETELQK
ncbi:MAG: dihydroxyacetone kinase subunit DhaK [Lachnospiraceae bacterium]|nr:dihydroxyacetone kinase subunit DhaK [Lachnospiraceae bacterium]